MSKKKPETPAEWAAYRCQASCKVGREDLEKKMQAMQFPNVTDYALYSLLHAVEDLSKQVAELMKP